MALVLPSSRRCLAPMLVLLLLAWLCAVVVVVVPAEAASAIVGSGSSSPAWRVGEVVPLTVYVRLARQVRRESWLFGRRGDVEDDVVEANEYDGFGNAQEAREARVKDANGVLEELEVDEEGLLESLTPEMMSGKHRFQFMRTLPPSVGPRFGMNKLATLRLHHWFNEAARQISVDAEGEAPPLQSELALRVSLGRGMKKETTWLPIAVRRGKLRDMGSLLFVEALSAHHADAAPVQKGQPAEPSLDAAVLFLTALRFEFGFQTGAVNTITSYTVKAHYTPIPEYAALANLHRLDADEVDGVLKNASRGAEIKQRRLDTVTFEYVWDEHRAFNPARAMTLCSGAALIGALVVVSITLNSRSKTSKQFRRRGVAVKLSDE